MIIWGRNAVLEALRAGKNIEKILIAHDTSSPSKIIELAKKKAIKVQKTSRRKIEELARTKKTQGVIALISSVEYSSEYELFEEVINKNGFFIVADHITDPQNLGNIIRTCEVFGGSGVLIPKDRSSPVNETVIKSSAGAVFHLKIAKVTNLANALKEFRKMGGWIFSVEKGGEDIRNIDLITPCALVVGSEGEGVSKRIIEISDRVVSIPMGGKVGSLNVSNACAIAIWELVRRKL